MKANAFVTYGIKNWTDAKIRAAKPDEKPHKLAIAATCFYLFTRMALVTGDSAIDFWERRKLFLASACPFMPPPSQNHT